MNQKQRARWEQARTKGMLRFILLYGILVGIAGLISSSVLDYFISYNGFRWQDLSFKVPIYLASGLLGGWIMWLIGEYQYRKK